MQPLLLVSRIDRYQIYFESDIFLFLGQYDEETDSLWSGWYSWSSCSKTCGDGSRSRFRQCLEGNCPGDDLQTSTCNEGACPTWGDWSSWGECSRSCDGGLKTKRRQCYIGSEVQSNPYNCYPTRPTEVARCNQQSCDRRMIYWENQISYGSYIAIDSGMLSGKGDFFQQCADYCISFTGRVAKYFLIISSRISP